MGTATERMMIDGKTAPLFSAAQRQSLRRRLLAWYAANKRDLPWRRSRDPYRVWISEIMLQQTQVATVGDYFERFIGTFPDVHRLAAANELEVLRRGRGSATTAARGSFTQRRTSSSRKTVVNFHRSPASCKNFPESGRIQRAPSRRLPSAGGPPL